MQTKNTLWIVGTIWANIIIIGILVGIATSFIGIGYLGLFNPVSLSETSSLAIKLAGYVMGVVIIIFSVWLGVHSVLKKTPVDIQNYKKIAFWVVFVSIILQMLLLAYGLYFFGSDVFTLSLFGSLIINDALVFVSTLYFLKLSTGQEGRNMLIAIVAITTLVGVGLNYWNQQNSQIILSDPIIQKDETADWKVYRNDFYGFEFRYPPQAEIVERGAEQGPNFPLSNAILVQQPNEIGGQNNIFGVVLPEPNFIKNSGQVYTHFITDPKNCTSNLPDSKLNIENIRLGSYSGKRITELASDEKTYQIYYCIAHPKNPLIIYAPQSVMIGYEEIDPILKDFNKILESFIFLNSQNENTN